MIETNKIYCGDCLEILSGLPDKSIDLVFTSPPYNMRTRIRNGEYTTREKTEHFSKKYKHFDDALPIDEFYSFHKKVLTELLRVSKLVLYNFQIVTGSKEAFFKIIGDFHKDIKDIIVWDKRHGQPAMHSNILNNTYELILILEDDKKCGRMIQNAIFKRGTLSNVWRVIGNKKTDVSGHSASFPEELAKIAITNFSKEGDIVLDPFLGTGTVALVAKKNNRKYIGIEICEEYYKAAEVKLSQPTIFEE